VVAWLAIAGSLIGWLILIGLATGGPRLLSRAASHRDVVPMPATEPPAVVGLLAGRPDADLFTVTLPDLAARGWFSPTGSLPAMCALPAETRRRADAI
jgi:hypothetical protein